MSGGRATQRGRACLEWGRVSRRSRRQGLRAGFARARERAVRGLDRSAAAGGRECRQAADALPTSKDIRMNTHVSNHSSPASVALAIRNLALKSIEPSATAVQERRRTHYDAAALKDLAENIKAVHVIEPIIVRPKHAGKESETFEIVAGERRWRASREAGLDTIPAIVRTLDDSQVLEIQLVENLYREGLHELEEAEGYEILMQQHHYDIEQLSAKIGRSRAYVYARLKLLALDKKSREAFYAGKLTAATALLLARIPVPALQQDALKAITATWNGQPLPFKEAQRHIQDRYMTRLKDAPFDAKAADLVPGAGPCSACPKLTGNQPELFGDIKNTDVCTDPVCYAGKRAAWGQLQLPRGLRIARSTVLRGRKRPDLPAAARQGVQIRDADCGSRIRSRRRSDQIE